MKKNIKDLWVAALRSGRYEQGKGQLRRGDEFCCLGVLCDLALSAGVRMVVRHIEDTSLYDEISGVLPPAVMDWAGLRDPGGRVGLGTEVDLVEMNDVGVRFDEIADVIDRHWRLM